MKLIFRSDAVFALNQHGLGVVLCLLSGVLGTLTEIQDWNSLWAACNSVWVCKVVFSVHSGSLYSFITRTKYTTSSTNAPHQVQMHHIKYKCTTSSTNEQ